MQRFISESRWQWLCGVPLKPHEAAAILIQLAADGRVIYLLFAREMMADLSLYAQGSGLFRNLTNARGSAIVTICTGRCVNIAIVSEISVYFSIVPTIFILVVPAGNSLGCMVHSSAAVL